MQNDSETDEGGFYMRKNIHTLFIAFFYLLFTTVFLFVKVPYSATAEPVPVSPAPGECVSRMPPAQAAYESPEKRGWNADYDPQTVKNGGKECSFPNPVRFSWQRTEGVPTVFFLQISEDSGFQNLREIPCGAETSAEISNFRNGQKYFWRVKAVSGEKSTFSAECEFMTAPESPCWLAIPGLSNVRDIGGWKTDGGGTVKQGKVFRGSEFDAHMQLEPEGKRILLEELNLRTDLDLRGTSELKNSPNYTSPLGSENVRWMNVPLSAYDGIFTDSQKKKYREIFELLTHEETYPVYVHCWGGADRTGTLILILEAILGVSDDDLCTDYELTTLAVFGRRSIHSELFEKFLTELEKYGETSDPLRAKAERFLLSAGVMPEDIEKIRNILLEKH